ncbi:MAG: hypothetical protein MZW92_36130 [Comamonadaceae bacterium]|nr:hypothetical protein [Comamonadaceae bacterium]
MTSRHRSGAPDVLQVRDLACRRGPALLFSGHRLRGRGRRDCSACAAPTAAARPRCCAA